MSPSIRLWLVRHAPVAGADAGRINGQRDVPCDTTDRLALFALAGALPRGARVLCSPLTRCKATLAAAIDSGFRPDGPETLEPDLMEQDFGAWAGKSWAELTDHPLARRMWAEPATTRPPDGESFADQVARVGPLLERIVADTPGGDVVLVCHAGTIRAALAVALNVDPAAALAFQIDPLSLTRLDAYPADPAPGKRRKLDGGWAVVWVNRPCRAPGPDP
ncbi:histidine phosphatase family protein [Roseospirillum parvum]|uniref:Alpha-ribazole phosphatase n=1 Tax=Roseospirillum parvum TaxID=83401 RepID=A0A1G8FXV8_9PROT|nr:histidine phosphatase family protein [Roseospirillum parvum]SDH86989.1 alpha-ribazole phosphatase [Roseospirillum parvum]